jgi:hypothetical protein
MLAATICTVTPRTPFATGSAIKKNVVSVEATKKMGAGYGSPSFPLPAPKSRRRDCITNGWLEHVGVAIAITDELNGMAKSCCEKINKCPGFCR